MNTFQKTLKNLGLTKADITGGSLDVFSPICGSKLASVKEHTPAQAKAAIAKAQKAFLEWRTVPAPKRGQLIRILGEELRKSKEDLATLITIENGKILTEGRGEVQEMIDICDLGLGLSKQLFGLTIASERPGHHMRETWHPMGTCAVISAFNFPAAVWSWNAALAIICGNPVIWKPSEKTPLTALATQKIFERAIARFGDAPKNLSQLLIGDARLGEILVDSKDIPVVSATGSTRMGRIVGPKVAQRFGRSILELGGNNAAIIAPSADLEMSIRAITFSAVGTAGQRCTTLRRIIVHESLKNEFVKKLSKIYKTIKIGNPLDKKTLVGPLIDKDAFEKCEAALKEAKAQGGKVYGGGRAIEKDFPDAYYVHPALVEMQETTEIVREETFAPILYVIPYKTLEEAIAIQNDVPQGLSSCIFTTDMREAEYYLSAAGSDCGIANVNIGTSGAEIGGAFGGEKETGGGRESGSDAWKAYMRRQTNTINYSKDLPLAQGVEFKV